MVDGANSFVNPFEILFAEISKMNIKMDQVMVLIDEAKSLKKSNDEAPIRENLSIKELREYLNISESTAHRYKNNKMFSHYKAGRTVFFKRSEVDEAMSSQPKKKGASK